MQRLLRERRPLARSAPGCRGSSRSAGPSCPGFAASEALRSAGSRWIISRSAAGLRRRPRAAPDAERAGSVGPARMSPGSGLFSAPGCPGSIVSAAAFHFRVRDGNGWFHRALTTRTVKYGGGRGGGQARAAPREPSRRPLRNSRKPHPAPSPWGEGGGEGEDSLLPPKAPMAQRNPGGRTLPYLHPLPRGEGTGRDALPALRRGVARSLEGAEDATRAQRLLRPCDWLVAGEGFEPPTFGL